MQQQGKPKGIEVHRIMTREPAIASHHITGPGRVLNGLVLFQVALFVSIVNFSLDLYREAVVPEESLARQLSWIFFGTSAFLFIFFQKSSQRGWPRLHFGLPLWLFIAYAYSSTLWSEAPSSTIKRTTLLLIVVLICASLNRHLERTGTYFGTALKRPLIVILALSVLIVLVAPGVAITEIGWRGICTHKNEFGQLAAIGTFAYVCRPNSGKRSVVRTMLGLGSFAVALLLSRSTTALFCVFVSLLLIGLINVPSIFKRCGAWQVPILAALALVLVAAYLAFLFDALLPAEDVMAMILDAFGKSSTLTGRTKIWQSVLAQSDYHSDVIGGGYGGFWGGPDSISAAMSRTRHINPGQAHNGYLDIYNDLGIVGLTFVALMLLWHFSQIWIAYRLSHPEADLHLAIIVFVLLLNLTESTLLRTNTFMNILFLASHIRLNAICRAGRKSGAAGQLTREGFGHAGI